MVCWGMTNADLRAADPHDEIERLEAQIDELAARLESCRKFILAGRVALLAGTVVLITVLFGLVSFDPRFLLAAIAAVLGGIVVWGSNSSTADEAAGELAKAEADRAQLIGQLQLHTVVERLTLH
jgi:hypothetical protein